MLVNALVDGLFIPILSLELPLFVIGLQVIDDTLTDVRNVLNIFIVGLYIEEGVKVVLRLLLKLMAGV